MPPFVRVLAAATGLLGSGLLAGCRCVELETSSTQVTFPIGVSRADAETGWRVAWTFEPHPTKPWEQYWVITRADFMRGHKEGPDGKPVEDWIRVLDRLAPAAMFVPYVEGGSRYRDFQTYYTGLAALDCSAAPKAAYKPSCLFQGKVMRETHDDFIRWIETGPGGYHGEARLRRGQSMVLWTLSSAYNYVYPAAVVFRDDGVIQVRMAASGQNLVDEPSATYAHLHMAAWQMRFRLCADGSGACGSEDVVVQTVSRRVVGGQEEIVVEPFHGGTEGGVDWDPLEFTALLITNPAQPNGRRIACPPGVPGPCYSDVPIGYALVPLRRGTARFKGQPSETFLDHDFWVTRLPPATGLPEVLFSAVDGYANGESLAGSPKVVWHKSAFNHIPRYEDLGFAPDFGFDANAGVALATFAGFDLVPRNVMHETPLYEP